MAGQDRQQNRLIGGTLVAAGSMLTLAGLLAIGIVIPLAGSDAASFVMSLPVFLQVIISHIPDGTPAALLILPGALIAAAGYAFIRRGRRHFVAASSARGQLPGPDTILYLRPFLADTSPLPHLALNFIFLGGIFETKHWTSAWLVLRGVGRYEELIAYAFRRLGRIVTIGDPKERLPQLGASRMYAPSGRPGSSGGEEWKTVVAEQIARAKLILLHVGMSSGLHWEIETVIGAADPLRVLLCINPAGKKRLLNPLDRARRREVDATWRVFREAHGALFPRGLPETVGDCRFIRFDAGWTAIPVQVTKRRLAWFVPTRPPWPGRDTIDGVLAWLLWLMIPEPMARRMARRTINFATFMVAFLGILTAIVMMATH